MNLLVSAVIDRLLVIIGTKKNDVWVADKTQEADTSQNNLNPGSILLPGVPLHRLAQEVTCRREDV